MTGHVHSFADGGAHGSHDHEGGDSTGELAARLRARGLRMTAQREQVLAAVRELNHATPEQISEAVPDVDLTTVYRTLELLEELGIVRHAHLDHGAPAYRPAEDEHVHVVCHTCKSVIDAPADLVVALEERLREERGFVVDRSHFTVFGRCADCRAADEQREQTAPAPPLPQ